MTREPLTYLASPYSHPDSAVVESRVVQTCYVAGVMLARGELVLSPIVHSHPIALATPNTRADWQAWERLDRRLLSSCDSLAVLMLPGWRESHGVTMEIAIARDLRMPIRYVDEEGREQRRPLLPLSPEAKAARRPPPPDQLIERGPGEDDDKPCDRPEWPRNGGCNGCTAECPNP